MERVGAPFVVTSCRRFGVLAAVALDGHASFDAVKVEDVARDGVLPSELKARELPVAREDPQLLLRVGSFVAHDPCEAQQAARVVPLKWHHLRMIASIEC